LFNAMLQNAFRGTPLAALVNGMNASGVAGADGVALLSGLSTAITGVSPADAAASGDDDEAKALLLAKAMIAAAKADGLIDDDERLNILNGLAEAGISPSARSWVEEEMNAPFDLDALVAEVSTPQLASEVFTASLMAIKVDTDAERSYLAALADRLGLKREAAEAA
jgi:uncharacterized membrane protein YebE (DUF533 family)